MMRFPNGAGAHRAKVQVGLEAAGLKAEIPRRNVAPAARPTASPTQSAPSSVNADPPSLDDLSSEFEAAFASGDAGEYEVAAPPPVARRTQTVAPPDIQAAATGSTAALPGQFLAYARPNVRAAAAEEEGRRSIAKDIYAPSVLLGISVLLSYVDAYLFGISNPIGMTGYVLFFAVANLFFVGVALAVAIKLMDLGLGPVGPAILKIAAIAILPGAVAGIVGHYTFYMVNWGMTVLCLYLMLFYLFEFDAQEMWITVMILSLVRWLCGFIVLIITIKLFAAAASSFSPPGSGSASSGPGGVGNPAMVSPGLNGAGDESDEDNQDAAEAQKQAAQIDASVRSDINSGKAQDAAQWLGAQYPGHVGKGMARERLLQWTERLSQGGAKGVYVSDIATTGDSSVCGSVLIVLPDDPDDRKRVLRIYDELAGNQTPTADLKQAALKLTLGPPKPPTASAPPPRPSPPAQPLDDGN